MAQKSIPFLNKAGISMFWNGMWDDTINYSKTLHKNLIIQNVVEQFIKNNNNINFFKHNYSYHSNISLKNEYSVFFFDLNFLKKKYIQKNAFISKIWFFRFNKWIVLFFISIFELKSNTDKYNFKNININNQKINYLTYFLF